MGVVTIYMVAETMEVGKIIKGGRETERGAPTKKEYSD